MPQTPALNTPDDSSLWSPQPGDHLRGLESPFSDGQEQSTYATPSVGFEPKPDEASLQRRFSASQRQRWGTKVKRDRSVSKRKTTLERFQSIYKPTPAGQEYPQDKQPVDPREPGRNIYFNLPLPDSEIDPASGLPVQSYVRNKIRTTKYRPLSFLPKNLLYQFKNVANIYFMFIIILGAFSIFGVASPGLAAVPIVVIVVLTAVKDAIEDYRRTVLDLEVNNTLTELLGGYDNPNLVDENVSLWRRFKKANTRAVMRIGGSIHKKREQRRKRKGKTTNSKSVFATQADPTLGQDVISLHSLDSDEPQNPFETDEADTVLNNSYTPDSTAAFQINYWKNVRVGDFVRVRCDQEIPADLVILSTSEEDGACYTETKNLDGETNLKTRQALRCGAGIKHAQDCQKAQFWIESEAPQPNLYTYYGVARWRPSDVTYSEPVSINNVLLRGYTLRNTKWVIGVVVYTGTDTKIILNAGKTPTKRSRLQRELNRYVIFNFLILFVLCFVSAIVNGVMHRKSDTSATFYEYGIIGGTPPVAAIVTFFAAVILYQSLVPISLYISIEIVKTCQAFFIYSDVYMYHEPLDYPCTPKSWNISDDLGQIEYVFSDKTGTLTQNVMEFKKCTINGVAYGKAYTEALAGLRKRQGIDVDEEGTRMRREIAEDREEMIRGLKSLSRNDQLVGSEVTFVSKEFVHDLQGDSGKEQALANAHFMLSLALCNTVITEDSEDPTKKRLFKAQSPDEAALVSAASDMGFTLVGRVRRGVIVNVQGSEIEYQVLNTIEFNSARKRMSAIVKIKRLETGKECILLICKGADSVIYERLAHNKKGLDLQAKTAVHLEEFANEGLRTLCIAEREISHEEYNEWSQRNDLAAAQIVDREEALDEVADTIERELVLLGGTAIEDRLQDGVPTTIQLLAEGGVKLWVLTGDKVETAINIGFSCNLLSNDMELLVIKVENNDKGSVPAMIDEYLHKHFGLQGSIDDIEKARKDHSVPPPHYAVVIDGDALKLALNPAIGEKFLLLCKQCRSVLCCRVSPSQKAAVVKLVNSTLGVMTLSIGDGANDVAMIQEADVGIGIVGEEGRQASMSSDYAIGQFRFLSRLMLVHGRWDYKRLAEMIPNFFYKNVVFTITLFWFGAFNNFDGSYLYEYTFVMLFNLAFTSLPVIIMGVLDQDVPDKISLAVPQLYRRGIMQADFNDTKFWLYMFEGLYQSFVSFFFPFFAWNNVFQHMSGSPLNHRFWMGLASCTISVMCCNFYVVTNQFRWDWFSIVVNVISSVLVFFWAGVFGSSSHSRELHGVGAQVYGSLVFWAVVLLGLVAALIPHFCILTVRTLLLPQDVDVIREQWKMGEFDEVMATPLAADDPDAVKYQNPYRATTHTPAPRTGTFRSSLKPMRKTHDPYTPRDDAGNIAQSPSSIRVGDRIIETEEHTWGDSLRDNPRISREMRRSLELARRNSRWEQSPREGVQNIGVSQHIDEVTTAANLLGSPNSPQARRESRGAGK